MPDHKNVVVAVRCRPLNAREKKQGGSCLVSMQDNQTTLNAEPSNGLSRRRKYNFDYSYWSADPSDPAYASQETVFADIGHAVLDHALSGYHCCVFAYGQTGSGKSYTMMGGQGDDAGLIPRICKQLFTTIENSTSGSFHVEVSYLEIYNERVRDLLNPRESGSLRVREHPALGPYVEDLTKAAVSTYKQVLEHMSQGNKARTVAATNMNEASSRSHAVFTIVLTHTSTKDMFERVSHISLVDLAGSERATKTMATGMRLKEGARINQSLASLGKVISALADQEPNSDVFVPYRDSVLTWLLKNSLGGNSRTFMIATISPSDYAETLSTLRYADRAKHIVNVATVNEDATVKLVRELKQEIAELRKRLELAGDSNVNGDLQDQLAANEKLIAELNQTWEDKLVRTQTLQMEREQALAGLGISIDRNREGMGVGLHMPRDIPHLVNLSEDPLMSECLVYNIKPGRTLVGATKPDVGADIKLGQGIAPRHCAFDYDPATSTLTVQPIEDNLVMVNGQRIPNRKELKSGCRIIIGTSYVFRLNHPQQARRERTGATQQVPTDSSGDNNASQASESVSTECDADWQYAWNEAHAFEDDSLTSGYNDRWSGFLPNGYAPTIWSEDARSEVSEIHALANTQPISAQYNAHLHETSNRRPTSQLSFRKPANLLRQRRNSAATDIVTRGPSIDLRQRTRGQTISIVASSPSRSSPFAPHNIRAYSPLATSNYQLSQTNRQSHMFGDFSPRPKRPFANFFDTQSITTTPEQIFWEQRLARLLLRQWRRYKLVKVGEQMLRNAMYLKEANVISKEMGQKVVYQFAILRGGAPSYPESQLEPDALPAILSDWDAISIHEVQGTNGKRQSTKLLDNPDFDRTVPEVVIKVLDIAHTCWYVWSLETFVSQLDKMRRLSTVKGSYRPHLLLDPFHTSPAPRYSCIGTCTYPLWPSTRPYSAKIDAPLVDLLSGLERGRVLGSLAALPVRNRRNLNIAGSNKVWSIIVHIKALHGINESEVTNVHCRMRLARIALLAPNDTDAQRSPVLGAQYEGSEYAFSLDGSDYAGGRCCTPDQDEVVLVSSSVDRAQHNAVSGFGDGPINIQFRQQWTVDMLTEDTCVVVEFFGQAQPLALRRAFQEDVQMEQLVRHPPDQNGDILSSSQNLLVERLHEEELFVDSHHELIVWIRMLELGTDGEWERAPCTKSQAFLLRQGLQRRVELVVSHNVSQHLKISDIAELSIGHPVLVDEKGRVADKLPVQPSIQLPIIQVQLAEENARVDNRCFTKVVASWDTSVYGSRLLNIPTDRGMRVKLPMHLAIEIDNGTCPIILSTSILVQIYNRQSTVGRNWLSSLAGAGLFFRSTTPPIATTVDEHLTGGPQKEYPPLSDPVSQMFSITLGVANPSRGKSELWRLNTGKKYVRGEETLLPWQPRSVQFVDEFCRLEHKETWRLLVARTREHLEAIGPMIKRPSAGWIKETRQALQLDSAPDGDLLNGEQTWLTAEQQGTWQLLQTAVLKIEGFRMIKHTMGLAQEPAHAGMVGNVLNIPKEDLSDKMDRRRLTLADIRQIVRRTPTNIRSITMQNHYCCRGWVDILDTNTGPDSWVSRWFVVERPYIFVFADKNCTCVDNVINISSARINMDPHVSELVGRRVLALYTNTNSYLLSPPADELQKWISAIDEWYFML
ncbi:hypothetical protein BX070DRAFT_222085 [Coemansia spiralis]|nr:hypothetical protein BX070DRAFT_222085 [Coemansia spiralis]